MTLGAEPKKVAILGLLLAVAVYLVYTNILSAPGEDSSASAAAPAAVNTSLPPIPGGLPNERINVAAGAGSSTARRRDGAVEEFRPSLKPREGKDKVDTAKIDPTLELYRLEQLQQVAFGGGSRNLFEFAAAPLPPAPKVIINPKPVEQPKVEAPPPPPPVPSDPPKPRAGPIPLKYYGFTQKEFEPRQQNGGARRGLFLRGDAEIFVGAEGDLIDRRYKVVRVQATSATLQDTQSMQMDNFEQTIPLERVPEN